MGVTEYLNHVNIWDGFIGASRSAVSTPLAMLGGIQGKPQISYASVSV